MFQLPVPQNVTIFGDRTFKEVIMNSYGLALIHSDWCPYKKRRLGHRHDVRTRGEDSHLQAKERDFRRNQTCQFLALGLPGSRTVRAYTLLFKPGVPNSRATDRYLCAAC